MAAAGSPSSSPTRKPAGSTVAKQVASASPGSQPSSAAQSRASEISCGPNVLMRKPPCISQPFSLADRGCNQTAQHKRDAGRGQRQREASGPVADEAEEI